MTTVLRIAATAAGVALALPTLAIQTCELNGQSVNPNNGYTTEGKTGLMRCRDADSGVVQREQELQNGKFMGVVRQFDNKTGQLEREHSVNERGNIEGTLREWQVDRMSGKRMLVREESFQNGSPRGISRVWTSNRERQRLSFFGDDGRQEAVPERTLADGRLTELRCAPRPVFGTDFDDKTACGHAGAASTVPLFGGQGQLASRVVFERGERRKTESLWESGTVRELRETTPTGSLERRFAADGTKLRETQWLAVGEPDAAAGARPRSVKVLEQEFHTSGTLIHETRWRPAERGAKLVAETHWYLNGQTRDRTEVIEAGTDRLRRERVYDERGRINREREFDERGTLLRDDEVHEDGSRKATSR